MYIHVRVHQSLPPSPSPPRRPYPSLRFTLILYTSCTIMNLRSPPETNIIIITLYNNILLRLYT